MNKKHKIGEIFGDQKEVLKDKIKDRKLIAKTKSTWDFCRNDIMHYQKGKKDKYFEMDKRYKEIVEIMILLFEDLYNTKTKPDDEIEKGYKKHVSSKYAGRKYKIKENLISIIRKL